MILNVYYSSHRGRIIYGFRIGMKLEAVLNENGVTTIKSPKTGVYMRVKNNGSRLFIRSMSGETIAVFSKTSV